MIREGTRTWLTILGPYTVEQGQETPGGQCKCLGSGPCPGAARPVREAGTRSVQGTGLPPAGSSGQAFLLGELHSRASPVTHCWRHEGPTTHMPSHSLDPPGPRALVSDAGLPGSHVQRPMLWSHACAQGPGMDPGPATSLSSPGGGPHLRHRREAGPRAGCEHSARGGWHQVVTVVGCVKKGANRQLALSSAPGCGSA